MSDGFGNHFLLSSARELNNTRFVRFKKQFHSDSLHFNIYDLLASGLHGVSTYSIVHELVWMLDGCHLNPDFQSKINYDTVEGFEYAIFVFACIFNLSCRFIKKRYQLQPLQKLADTLVSQDNSLRTSFANRKDCVFASVIDQDGGRGQFSYHRLVALDNLRYRLFCGVMGIGFVIWFIALKNIQDNHYTGEWKGCGFNEPLNVVGFIAAFLGGLAQENPLDRKRHEIDQLITERSHGLVAPIV